MASTISASDLLKSFASLIFTVFVDTVGDMLVDLLCASASVEPVRLDLELMGAVQHCRNLVAFLVPNRFRSAGLLLLCGVRNPPPSPLPS